jgi:hypothetical protein
MSVLVRQSDDKGIFRIHSSAYRCIGDVSSKLSWKSKLQFVIVKIMKEQ